MVTTHGTPTCPFSTMVRSTVEVHGVKWAFWYYVRKHGIPARHFRIFAGI